MITPSNFKNVKLINPPYNWEHEQPWVEPNDQKADKPVIIRESSMEIVRNFAKLALGMPEHLTEVFESSPHANTRLFKVGARVCELADTFVDVMKECSAQIDSNPATDQRPNLQIVTTSNE